MIARNECSTTRRWKWVKHKTEDVFHSTYRFDKYDPARGWALAPDISNMVYFKDKILNSNSKGIRGKIDYAYAKNKDKLRILILGDSFTFGEELSDNETYPFCLQQILPNAEVINLGVHGYGHDQMLVYLKEEGIKYRPDIVILGFIPCDMDRNMLEFRDYAKPKFELVNNELTLCNVPVLAPETTVQREFRRSKFIDLLNIFYNSVFRKTGLYEAKKKRLTHAILREIAMTAKSIGARPVFVYLGDIPEEQEFFDICKNTEADCVLLRSYFQSAEKQGININLHFDATTCRIIALGIKEYLLKSSLIGEKISPINGQMMTEGIESGRN